MDYTPTIGLEIHAELKTRTKMFCSSPNDPNEQRPNVNACPVCFGHPGTLPVINKEAVKHVLKIGLAVGGTLADYTEFDRKNYFYPDLPKGYQISQFQYPLVQGGLLAGVALTRVHLEEDTARSIHGEGGYSLVDFNRAGIPLMELVTEPVVKSAEQAAFFARELQLLLRYLGAGEANMEKGEMRVEANVSVSNDPEKLGTKVEIKNLNSFRSVERAIAYEVERQSELLEKGEKVVQETRGWDEQAGKTFSQRVKEELHDYRYFPDPDLPKLKLSELSECTHEALKKEMPELPWEKRERYRGLGLSSEDVETLVRSRAWGNVFEDAVKGHERDGEIVRAIASYITVEIPAIVKKMGAVPNLNAADLARIAVMKREGQISSRGVKDILSEILTNGGSPEEIAEKKGLLQKSGVGELEEIVGRIVAENETVADEYRRGKEAALQFLVGQGMKLSQGSANPEVLKSMLKERLS